MGPSRTASKLLQTCRYLLLAAGVPPLTAQIPLQFSSLANVYLGLTPTQINTVETNNASYVQAQRTGGRRVFELNRQVSVEIQKEEPDAAVVSSAYQEIESICRQRQTAHAALLQRNVAVLTEAQRTRLQALRYRYLRDRLQSRVYEYLLAPPQPTGQPLLGGSLPSLFSGTQFPATLAISDPRTTGIRELFEFLELSESQAEGVLDRNRAYYEELSSVFPRLVDLAEQLRRNVVQGASDTGPLVVELEKLRRQLGKRASEVLQANRDSLDDTQRRRIADLLALRLEEHFLFEVEAQVAFLLPTDEPRPDRPATYAGQVQVTTETQPPLPTPGLVIYPNGSRLMEPYFALRSCIAGPNF